MGKTLHKAWSDCNKGCVLVGKGVGGRVIKFCVNGQDDSVSFVHMSVDVSHVRCLSGECSVKAGCKKKLQGLETASDLCPHLNIFKASKEVWEACASARSQDGAEIQETEVDGQFDSASGLWSFGGLSTHKPTKREDQKLKRYVVWSFCFCGRQILHVAFRANQADR
jgi:hypothetical protein